MICVAAIISAFAEEVCVCVCERSHGYSGVCRGGVSVSDLWRRSCIGVCRGGVCVGDL